jgi:hypothetical protein
MPTLTDEIIEAVRAVQGATVGTDAVRTLRPYEPRSSWPENQALMFLKPEATAVDSGVQLEAVLELLFERMEHFGIETGAIAVVGSAQLRDSGVIERHYGVINEIANRGRAALSPGAEAELAKDLPADAEVLGGFEVLQAFADQTADSLEALVDSAGSSRLASGTYASRVEIDGRPLVVLNGFHPAQVEYYTAPGRAIVLIEGVTDLAWEKLRTEFTGATNPAKAAEGSVRAELRGRADELGLGTVDQSRNSLHCSAGPIEGLAELNRFLEVAFPATRAGDALSAAGFASDEVERLAANGVVDPESGLTSFDATEEMDTTPAVEKLKELSPGAAA